MQSVILIFLYVNSCKAYFEFNTLPTTEQTYKFTDKSEDKVEARTKTCLLAPDTGPCRSGIEMYYFDPETKTCVQFHWGGCQGNGNRFDTEKQCMSECIRTNDDYLRRPRYCELTFDYGYCFGSVPRWYYDRLTKTCKERIYSGCGGNKNNFSSREMCDNFCRFNKPLYSFTKEQPRDVNHAKRIIINPKGATVQSEFMTSDNKIFRAIDSETDAEDNSNIKVNQKHSLRKGETDTDRRPETSSSDDEVHHNENSYGEEIYKKEFKYKFLRSKKMFSSKNVNKEHETSDHSKGGKDNKKEEKLMKEEIKMTPINKQVKANENDIYSVTKTMPISIKTLRVGGNGNSDYDDISGGGFDQKETTKHKSAGKSSQNKAFGITKSTITINSDNDAKEEDDDDGNKDYKKSYLSSSFMTTSNSTKENIHDSDNKKYKENETQEENTQDKNHEHTNKINKTKNVKDGAYETRFSYTINCETQQGNQSSTCMYLRNFDNTIKSTDTTQSLRTSAAHNANMDPSSEESSSTEVNVTQVKTKTTRPISQTLLAETTVIIQSNETDQEAIKEWSSVLFSKRIASSKQLETKNITKTEATETLIEKTVAGISNAALENDTQYSQENDDSTTRQIEMNNPTQGAVIENLDYTLDDKKISILTSEETTSTIPRESMRTKMKKRRKKKRRGFNDPDYVFVTRIPKYKSQF